ncbi:MAG TPA: hypothetical protein VMA95_17950 [Streptosporangiaceae bacterium]|nr:hypothetical protein [Streptosporangiaceae bacterium]
MRSALENAISRRDDRLVRTRHLTAWIAGASTAASVGLAMVLGAAIPGHASASSGQAPAAPAGGSGRTHGTAHRSGQGTGHRTAHRHHHRGGLKPPAAPPASGSGSGSGGAPVVHTGGS